MKKHKLEKLLSSIFGSHISHEHSKFAEEKNDVDKNVEKIMKLINSEGKDTSSFGDSNEGSELVSLVHDFYGQYQVLYGRYDHLVEKLKKNVHHKRETDGSFSFNIDSSDSESSDSGSNEVSNNKKKSYETQESELGDGEISVEDYRSLQAQLESLKIRNGELETEATSMLSKLKGGENLAAELAEREAASLALEDELTNVRESVKVLQVENGDLKQELETSNQQQTHMCQRLRRFDEENEVLLSEKSMVLNRLQEADKFLEASKIAFKQLNDVVSKLQNDNGGLKQELEGTIQEVADLNQKLTSINEEKDALSLENFTVLSKIQQADKAVEDLSNEAGLNLQLTSKISSENAKLLSENEKLKLELESSKQQEADLIQRLATSKEEKNALISENLRATSQIQEAGKIFEKLRTEYELLKDEKSKLLGINEYLNQELRVKDDEKNALYLEHIKEVGNVRHAQEFMDKLSKELERLNDVNSQLRVDYEGLKLERDCEVFELKRMLQATQEARDALSGENLSLLSKIQGKMTDDLETEVERLKCDSSKLQIKIDDLVHELEVRNLRITDLEKVSRAKDEEKNTLTSEYLVVLRKMEQTQNDIKETENEVKQLREECSILQQNQIDLQHQNFDLGRRLEGKEVEVSNIQKELRDLDLLRAQNSKLEEQVKTVVDTASENQLLTEKLEAGLKGQIGIQETILKEQTDSFDELKANHKQLEDRFRESCEKLVIAQGKIAEMEFKDETIRILQKADQDQKKEISRLEENWKELSVKLKFSEAEKADVVKEIAKLHGQVQTLEVQIRLSNQKLKITETVHKEKEESHKRTVEELREERRKLEEQMLMLSSQIGLMENEFRRIKKVVAVGMESLTDGFHNLESVIEENCRHIQAQISECSDEVIIVKDWLTALIYEKEELGNEKKELMLRLNYREGIISMLRDGTGALGQKLATKVKEEEGLRAREVESQKKMEELEKKVKEKEEELLFKNEEKREAIRQLCLLIEYHRENCDHLCKFLSATLKRSRRSA